MLGLGLSLPAVATRRGVFIDPDLSLDLDFMAGILDPRIVVTRTGTATRFNESGVLESVAANTARIDHDPVTLARRGLLVEEARTNSIRNNSMAGAAVGTLPTNWGIGSLAGITPSVVGTGTEDGLPYLDVRYVGTATGTLEISIDGTTTTAAAEGQVWTSSVYVKLAGGSLTNITFVQVRMYQHGTTNQTPANITPTSAALRTQRVQATRTMTTGTTNTQCRLSATFAGAVDVTLRFGAPQLEQGAFASSVILTTTAAVTRAVDQVTVPVDTWFNAAAGTMFADLTPVGVGTGLQHAIYLDDATNNERFGLRSSGASMAMLAVDGGVTQVNIGVGSLVAGTAARVAMAYALNDFAACQNGGTVQTDTSATIPTPTRLLIGSRLSGTEAITAHFRKARFYKARKPNAELQTLTA